MKFTKALLVLKTILILNINVVMPSYASESKTYLEQLIPISNKIKHGLRS